MNGASIVIPTRERLDYLQVALASIAAQAARVGAEILVVDDAGPSEQARALVESFGARYEPHPRPLGLNAARNTGVRGTTGELVIFLDDDIRARGDWLEELLAASASHDEVEVLAGRVLPRLEGDSPRGCSSPHAPVTTLDLGTEDTDTRFAWGANMAIRRRALERVGDFDESLAGAGDEQEWQERLFASDPSARVLYVARAAVEHRRAGADARLHALARAAYRRGRAARRFDERRGAAPARSRELATLARCTGHVLRRRCALGATMVAHSAGRLRQALRGAAPPSHVAARATDGPSSVKPLPTDDFLSGESGTVGGTGALARALADRVLDAWETASGRSRRLARAARHRPPRRRVLALCVARPEHAPFTQAIRAELASSRHDVQLFERAPAGRGKFQNLNLLLAEHSAFGYDWLLVLDDDVQLPRGFVDRFLFLCERYSLALAQPAHRLDSHAAWRVTRRRARAAVHETSFVEIGPVTAFAHPTFETLLPFPDLQMGWGLDAHWAALARSHGWRCGVVDAVPIRHRAAPVGASYPRAPALAEARAFLADRPYVTAREAQRVLSIHRGW